MMFERTPNLVTVAEMVADFTARAVRTDIASVPIPSDLEEECTQAELVAYLLNGAPVRAFIDTDGLQVDCEQDALMTVVEDKNGVSSRILAAFNPPVEAVALENVIERMVNGELSQLMFV